MEHVESSENTPKRDENGRLLPGYSLNYNGRPPATPEQKALRKASKLIIEEYKQSLIDSLPMISPILISKAMLGDIPAIKELHDRALDKAKQSTEITGKDGKDLFGSLSDEDRAKLDLLANVK